MPAMPLLCVGATDGAKCKFGPNKKRAQVAKGALRCTWCDPEKLEEVMLLSKTRNGALIKFKTFDPDLQQIIIGRAPAWCKKAFVENAERRKFCAGRPADPCIFALLQKGLPTDARRLSLPPSLP